MTEFIATGPIWAVFAFLTVVVFLRASATYWLGRWVSLVTLSRRRPDEGWRKRLLDRLEAAANDQGISAIQRWGLVVLPFSFLTVGFQTMVNAGAGMLRIPWWKYTLAILPGCLAWATIYSTIGFAVWQAGIAAAAGSPWGVAAIAAVILVFWATKAVRRRRRANLIALPRAAREPDASVA